MTTSLDVSYLDTALQKMTFQKKESPDERAVKKALQESGIPHAGYSAVGLVSEYLGEKEMKWMCRNPTRILQPEIQLNTPDALANVNTPQPFFRDDMFLHDMALFLHHEPNNQKRVDRLEQFILQSSGKEQAMARIKKVDKTLSQYMRIQIMLADLFYGYAEPIVTRNLKRVEYHCRKACQIGPGTFTAHLNLARVLGDLEKYSEAVEFSKKAYEIYHNLSKEKALAVQKDFQEILMPLFTRTLQGCQRVKEHEAPHTTQDRRKLVFDGLEMLSKDTEFLEYMAVLLCREPNNQNLLDRLQQFITQSRNKVGFENRVQVVNSKFSEVVSVQIMLAKVFLGPTDAVQRDIKRAGLHALKAHELSPDLETAALIARVEYWKYLFTAQAACALPSFGGSAHNSMNR